MNSHKLFLFVFILIHSFSLARTAQQDTVWVATSAEIPLANITMDEARIEVLRMARQNAIGKVCGVMMQSETLVRDFTTAGDFIHAVSCGEIVGEKNMTWNTRTIPGKSAEIPPVIVLQVSMEIKVRKSQSQPDPYFKIRLEPNQTTFQSGDEMKLKVSATQDCYLTVLNLAADDTVYVLFPNNLKEEVFLKANESVMLPDKNLQKQGFHLRVYPMPGSPENIEIIKVIATRQRLPILEILDLESGIGQLGTPRFAVQKLAKALAEIPVNERAEATQMITIRAKR